MTCNVCYLSFSVTKTGNFRVLVELPVRQQILSYLKLSVLWLFVHGNRYSVFVLVEDNLIEILNQVGQFSIPQAFGYRQPTGTENLNCYQRNQNRDFLSVFGTNFGFWFYQYRCGFLGPMSGLVTSIEQNFKLWFSNNSLIRPTCIFSPISVEFYLDITGMSGVFANFHVLSNKEVL